MNICKCRIQLFPHWLTSKIARHLELVDSTQTRECCSLLRTPVLMSLFSFLDMTPRPWKWLVHSSPVVCFSFSFSDAFGLEILPPFPPKVPNVSDLTEKQKDSYGSKMPLICDSPWFSIRSCDFTMIKMLMFVVIMHCLCADAWWHPWDRYPIVVLE